MKGKVIYSHLRSSELLSIEDFCTIYAQAVIHALSVYMPEKMKKNTSFC